MQTLKTAAIVVLLMTVMYGAYVSLTTPPEPLPADVAGLLLPDADEPLAGIDIGLPDSLSDITRQPAGDATQSSVDHAHVPSVDTMVAGMTGGGSSGPAFQDLPNGSFPSGVETSLSDLGGPSVELSASSGAQSENVGAGYPNTGSTFELPDPNSVASSFDPSQGSAPLPSSRSTDTANDLLQASGTSDPNSREQPPSSGNVQTAGLPGATATSNLGLANAIRTADKQYQDDKRRDALATLSIFYNAPNLSGEQRSELLSRLDPLAREVIYSRRHLLEMPHRVGQDETLMDIAERYEVPWQLLANINQIYDPVTILPGTELKVVRGPFRAEVDLTTKELTLFLGDLYAGRFPVGIGNDPEPKTGTYTIQDKQTSKTYYDHAGSPVPPGSPANPYGNAWLDLGGQVCIHGSPSTTSPTESGCISLAADYADDLYGILSQGSSVTIRR